MHHGKWDFVIFTLLTLLSVWNGGATVFYVLYFFWWNEFIRIVVDGILAKKNPNAKIAPHANGTVLSSLFQMGIYLVFIVVLFAFLADWGNREITIINIGILFFRNWFFNINLLMVFLQRIYLHKTKQEVAISSGNFTANMIVLHVSIVLGAGLMFGVVDRYPDTFTPDNLWASVLIILPFILVRALVHYFRKPRTQPDISA